MENILTGFHAVEERVRKVFESKNKEEAKKMSILFDKPGPRIKKILALAKDAGIKCENTTKQVLDSKVASLPPLAQEHRGIVLCISGEEQSAGNMVNFDQFITSLDKDNAAENYTVVILDSITDPHNVGAIIRSADQFGIDLVIIPDHRSTGDVLDNEVIARSSAGASAWVKVSMVSNLVRATQLLKDKGFWIYGADAGGTSVEKVDFSKKTAIVMGSEGNGIAHLLTEQCDEIVSIPTCGKLDSLNVSVAAGILLYERRRQNLSKN